MKRDYLLSIENPCEKILWESMAGSENGKFCNLCSKNVIDFSILTDAEIIKIIENPSRDICAKMSVSQTNRLLNNQYERKKFHLSKTITTLLLIGSAKVTFASNTNINKKDQTAVFENYKSISQFSNKTLYL